MQPTPLAASIEVSGAAEIAPTTITPSSSARAPVAVGAVPPDEEHAPAAVLPSSASRSGLEDVPPHVAQTLKAMQGQLEMMARTVQLLERRLAVTESQVCSLSQELGRPPPARDDVPPEETVAAAPT